MIDNFDTTTAEILTAAAIYSDRGCSPGEKANYWGRIGAVIRAHDARIAGDTRAFIAIADVILGPYPALSDVERVVNTTTTAWRHSRCATPISNEVRRVAHEAYARYATWRAVYGIEGRRVAPPSWRDAIVAAMEGGEKNPYLSAAAHWEDVSDTPPRTFAPVGTELAATIVAGERCAILHADNDTEAHVVLGVSGDWTMVPATEKPLLLDSASAEEAYEALARLLSR